MALHLEDGRLSVANIDNAGIFSRPLDYAGIFGREFRQMAPGRLVGAMLGPHHRVYAEFDKVWLAPKARDEAFPLIGLDAVFETLGLVLGGCQVGEYRRSIRHARALDAKRASRQPDCAHSAFWASSHARP